MALKYMDSDKLLRIDALLKHIDLVLSDVNGVDITSFDSGSILVRGVCFSISQIGEQMVQLEKKIGKAYPDLPWIYARSMRNVIVHDYNKVDIEQISLTIKNDLPQLKDAFTAIRKDFA